MTSKCQVKEIIFLLYMPDPPAIYAPCLCGAVGAFIGGIISASLSIVGCLPAIIGVSLGGGIGCIYCMTCCFYTDDDEHPIYPPIIPEHTYVPNGTKDQIIIENPFMKPIVS